MKRMTLESVRAGVIYVESLRGDDEAAHGAEDALHRAVLLAIAEGLADDPVACAAEALRTIDADGTSFSLKFARWCA